LVFAVLWATGMIWRSPSIDLQSVTTAVVAGLIVAWLIYWLLDKFSGRSGG
jgi:high-affinity Fe2+/Pb2+ permease